MFGESGRDDGQLRIEPLPVPLLEGRKTYRVFAGDRHSIAVVKKDSKRSVKRYHLRQPVTLTATVTPGMRIGDRVRHALFGWGDIVGCSLIAPAAVRVQLPWAVITCHESQLSMDESVLACCSIVEAGGVYATDWFTFLTCVSCGTPAMCRPCAMRCHAGHRFVAVLSCRNDVCGCGLSGSCTILASDLADAEARRKREAEEAEAAAFAARRQAEIDRKAAFKGSKSKHDATCSPRKLLSPKRYLKRSIIEKREAAAAAAAAAGGAGGGSGGHSALTRSDSPPLPQLLFGSKHTALPSPSPASRVEASSSGSSTVDEEKKSASRPEESSTTASEAEDQSAPVAPAAPPPLAKVTQQVDMLLKSMQRHPNNLQVTLLGLKGLHNLAFFVDFRPALRRPDVLRRIALARKEFLFTAEVVTQADAATGKIWEGASSEERSAVEERIGPIV
eukprot:PLAT4993.2.p1 GENE.PLAT4993.2~~PLAT4993.2.p1  ORF type:complete len:447 (+),score=165.86 PLAT4993.2:210-1550(+)